MYRLKPISLVVYMSVSTCFPWGRWSPGRVNWALPAHRVVRRLPQVLAHTSQTEHEASWISEGDCASCVLSRFSCVWLCVILWTVACQSSLSMGFSKREYWSGLPCPPPRNLPDPGVEPASPAAPCIAGGFFTTEPPENPSSPHSSTHHLFFRIFMNDNVTVKEQPLF